MAFGSKSSEPEAGLISGDGPHVEDVIEGFGLGRFQVCIGALVLGSWAADGVEIAFCNILTKEIALDLGVANSQQAVLASALWFGLLVGSGVGGYVGDNVGRRVAMLLSYMGSFVFVLLSTVVTNYTQFVATRLLQGVSMGVGMPASLVMLNELVPSAWRVFVFGARGLFSTVGLLFALTVVLLDDPSLERLAWRRAVIWGSLPLVVLGVVTALYLPESPVFLAHSGRPREALQVLEHIRRWNKTLDVDVSFAPPKAADVARPVELSWTHQFGLVFSHGRLFSTVALIGGCWTINLVDLGTGYADPLVLTETAAALPAGWQLFMKGCVQFPVRLAAIPFAYALGRKGSIVVGMTLLNAGGMLLFAWSGSLERGEFGPAAATVYYVSQYATMLGVGIGFLTLYQISVDLYPPVAAATGSFVVSGGGRLGSVAAPFLFELTPGHWRNFFFILAAACVAAALLLALADVEPYHQKQQQEDAIAREPLRRHAAASGGAGDDAAAAAPAAAHVGQPAAAAPPAPGYGATV